MMRAGGAKQADLTTLAVRPVRDAAAQAEWDRLMDKHHYLGFRGMAGGGLRHALASVPASAMGEFAARLDPRQLAAVRAFRSPTTGRLTPSTKHAPAQSDRPIPLPGMINLPQQVTLSLPWLHASGQFPTFAAHRSGRRFQHTTS